MSSSEPPSRIPPRGQSHESKSVRDELSSKGKVEKVREVDADEARKRRFRSFYEDDVSEKERGESENRPSPFDLVSGKGGGTPLLGSNDSGMEEVEEAIIPSPAYTPPPDVSSSIELNEDEENDGGTKSLPQSDRFWHNVDFPPDQPPSPRSFHETTFEKGGEEKEKKRGKTSEKREGAAPFPDVPHESVKQGKKGEPSPFGPPGKSEQIGDKWGSQSKKEIAPQIQGRGPLELEARKKKEKEVSPFDVAASMKKETTEFAPGKTEKNEKKRREQIGDGITIPMERGKRETERERGHDSKTSEIIRTTLPPMPSYVEPLAAKAMTQATPYIQPSTAALFYQMVGTMYVMAGLQGVNRTEVVLNNGAFSNSKFFGSTIQIEKYATAPDSFNITLSGSNEAVVSFKENIPSLIAAFQNGNFTFRVNRLDVEYRIEKPVYRRKESEERGESGGGDLGERRK